MFESKNKTDLMIEIWEKLDCESVGRKEIVEIENIVREKFGEPAVDSPMTIARLLADEGAELRHSELMELYVSRAGDRPYDAALNNLFDLSTLPSLHRSLRNAENLRKKFTAESDKEGLRLLRNEALETKKAASEKAVDKRISDATRAIYNEAAEWIKLWLQSPELFESWVKLRQASKDYKTKFAGK